MKKLLFLLIVLTAFTFRFENPASCRPYIEAVKNGTASTASSSIVFNDGSERQLDYVRGQDYRDYPHFCFGYLELGNKEYTQILNKLTPKYSADSTYAIAAFAQGDNLEEGNSLRQGNIRYLMAKYRNSRGDACLDVINLSDGTVESHGDSGYASAHIYLHMQKTGFKNKASVTEIRNTDFDKSTLQFLPSLKDPLYKLANPR